MKEFDLGDLYRHARLFVKKTSAKGLYIILLLFYAYRSGEVPSWAKKIIIGSLAYFVSPIDSIPDLTPILGMTDDLGILAFGLVTISCYVNDEVREAAVNKLSGILDSEIDFQMIQEVDSWL